MTAPSTQRVYAEAFLDALAKRDYDAISRSLHRDVAFRALLPSRVAEHQGAAAVVAELRGWFEEPTDFAMLGSSVDEVADRTRIWFRIRARDDDGWAVVEQTGFCDADGDGITSMNLVCSGWREIESPRGT